MEDIKELEYFCSKLSILYVEDSVKTVAVMEKFLKVFFENVYSALDGEEGLDKFQDYRPDILITDIHLPHLDGMSLLKEIKDRGLSSQVIVISSNLSPNRIKNLKKLGVNNFISKPIVSRKLLGVIMGIAVNLKNLNRRKEKRYLVDSNHPILVVLNSEEFEATTKILNISYSGMALLSEQKMLDSFGINETVSCKILIAPGDKEEFILTAVQIKRKSRKEFGVLFLGMEKETRNKIRELVDLIKSKQ